MSTIHEYDGPTVQLTAAALSECIEWADDALRFDRALCWVRHLPCRKPDHPHYATYQQTVVDFAADLPAWEWLCWADAHTAPRFQKLCDFLQAEISKPYRN